MNSELNLKGHVEIFDQSGNKILDEHNMITNIGKEMILRRMCKLADTSIPNAVITPYIKFIALCYTDTDVNLNSDLTTATLYANRSTTTSSDTNKGVFIDMINELCGIADTDSKMTTANVNNYGNLYNCQYDTDNKIYIVDDRQKSDGTFTNKIAFTDSDGTVTVNTKTADGYNMTAAVFGGFFSSDNKLTVYVAIKGSASNKDLRAISLAGSAYSNKDGILQSDSNGDYKLIGIPFTALSFNIGQLAASTTYVIKYTLYM